MNKIKLVCVVLLTISTLTACGDEYFYNEEDKKLVQAIVYGVLNVLPINEQNILSMQTDSTNKILSKKEYLSSILSRSTVSISTSQAVKLNLKYKPGAESDPNAPADTKNPCNIRQSTRGSGNLVSSTRISTAHHVLHEVKPEGEANEVTYDVLFDGNTAGKLQGTNENPLLSNRLHAFGLRSWASASSDSAVDTRAFSLRQWRALEEKSFATVDRQKLTIKGTDISILNTLPRTIGYKAPLNTDPNPKDFYFLPKPAQDYPATPSGPFNLDRPGVFFDISPHKPFTQHTGCEADPISNKDPIWALHHNYWPAAFNTSSDNIVNLVSNPGYKDNSKLSKCFKEPLDTCIKNTTGNFVIGSEDYDDCARTTLDVLRGSSGGGVLLVECSGDHGTKTDSITLRGVLSSVNNVGSPPKSLTTNANWTDDIVTIANEAGQAKFDAYTGVSIFTKVIDDAASKELYPNPQNPEWPEQPLSDNGFEPGTIKKNGAYSTPKDEQITGFGSNESPVTTPQTTSGTGSSTPKDYSLYRCKPGPHTNYRIPHGVALGVTGVSTHSFISSTNSGDPARVGALGLVCGPWSSAPWTNNYVYLWVYGYTKSKAQLLDKIVGLHNLLHVYFFAVAERRAEILTKDESKHADIFRPASMQMCPPNYYLHGLEFRTKALTTTLPDNTTDTRPEVVGITSITCAMSRRRIEAIVNLPGDNDWKTEGEQLSKKITIPLAHSNHREYKWTSDLYFSLSQHIGNPYITADPDITTVSTSCDTVTTAAGEEYLPVTGLLLETKTQGIFRGLQIQCAGSVP